MQPLTVPEIRASFVNATLGEAERVPMPGLHEVIWESREYLGWRDPQAHQRGYLVHWRDGTPIGIVPTAADLDLEGLDVKAADVDEALAVRVDEWRNELPLIEEWFEFVGEKLPTGIKDEFDALKHRLAEEA